jgi:hypothetical protein
MLSAPVQTQPITVEIFAISQASVIVSEMDKRNID